MKRIRSKHNNLLNYFICDKRDLSPAYVASCEKFLEEISRKRQASSFKHQASSSPAGLSLNTIKMYKLVWLIGVLPGQAENTATQKEIS